MTAYEVQQDGTLREVADPPERVDLVQVVRCRDCKWFRLEQSGHLFRSRWWCKWWNTDIARPDTFCAWGRRADG